MEDSNQRLLRIGVFYDGNFFFHVSNYYRYTHARRKRISIPGLHEYIRLRAAEEEGVDVRYCRIIDAHLFRGRLSARDAKQREKLYAERVFDDILMEQGVLTHYLPVREGYERGVDVWLALEAFELVIQNRIDLIVLIGGDADFVPLVQKVNSHGSRVMLLGWNFQFTDEQGRERETVTSNRLINRASYPILMNQSVGDEPESDDPHINGLFVVEQDHDYMQENMGEKAEGVEGDFKDAEPVITERYVQGSVLSIKSGFGFISAEGYPNNLFFHFSQTVDCDFNDFTEGVEVVFDVAQGPKGFQAVNVSKR